MTTSENSNRIQFDLSLDAFNLNVDLSLPNSGIIGVFGHSGCGKTTLLRALAGLLPLTTAYININGQLWQQQQKALPTHQRPLGFVFQDRSLLLHLTVQANLDYASKRCWPSPKLSASRIIELFDIGTLLHRRPEQLSGGEAQRVTLARSLLINPAILLMDEPLSALDLSRKQEIINCLKRLKSELNIAIIYVSHDVDEMAQLADYLVVMEKGKIQAQGAIADMSPQLGVPSQSKPDSGAAETIVEAIVVEREADWKRMLVSFNGGHFWLQDSVTRLNTNIDTSIGVNVRLHILAKDVSIALSKQQDSSVDNILPATITDIQLDNQDATALIQVQVGEISLFSQISQQSQITLGLHINQNIWIQINAITAVN